MNTPKITPDQRRFLQHLEGIAARQFAHEFLLESLFTAALIGRTSRDQSQFILRLGAIARERFNTPPEVSGEGGDAARRMNAQALFNIENLVDKLRRSFPGSPAPAPTSGAENA